VSKSRDEKTPAIKQRTALVRKLKDVFRRWHSQPLGQLIATINDPAELGELLPGRTRARCFGFVKEWVEKKVRRHLMRARVPAGLRLEAVEYGEDLYGARGL